MSVITKIIQIGNSQGVCIPKPLLAQMEVGERVILTVEGNKLIISPADKARQGWREALKQGTEIG